MANRDYMAISQSPVYLRWVEKYSIWELKNLKLFSLFFLSYTLQCKWSELELEIIGRMTSQTFFNHQFVISGLNSISLCVEIGFSLGGVRFADTLSALHPISNLISQVIPSHILLHPVVISSNKSLHLSEHFMPYPIFLIY